MKKRLMLFVCLLVLSAACLLASCGKKDSDGKKTASIAVENGLAVYMPEDKPLKIAQFADLHFGKEGNNYHNNRVERTKAYMQQIVDKEKPDLIVCSGDNIMTTGVLELKEFVDLMESYKTPWTFIYGNHDAESTAGGYNKQSLSEFLDMCQTEYLLYNGGYIDTDNNRYGNFSISVLNHDGSKQLGAVILLDGGGYNTTERSYDSITEGQIDWYKKEIDKLNKLYTGEGTMPSIVFSHIQLPEYYTAYKAAFAEEGASFVMKQDGLTPAIANSIRSGGPTNVNTGFFDVMKEKESTVAFFCGHEHRFDFQVEMDGIVLGFGPQTGFSTLFGDNDLLRKTHIYCFEENFDFTTISCVEDGSNVGLAYTGTFDDTAEFDEPNGVYTASHNFNTGNTIQFSYKGERLTTENTKVSGHLSESSSSADGGFYSSDGKTFTYAGTSAGTCTFTYNPTDGTLVIGSDEVQSSADAPTSLTFKTVDSDAGAEAISLWTTPGTKLKTVDDITTGEGEWLGNNWRYYVVVDSEGRVAYGVLHPLSGYGGPLGKAYYTHPTYSNDYTSNPAIVALEGFKDDWAAGGIGYTLFEIVVPEGGFAITGHGAAVNEIIDMLSQGTVEDYGVANVNTRSIYKSNIRLSYDLENKTISLYTVEE